MTSILYQRTERGNLELDNRQIRLTARQRALLLLVESTAQSILNQQQLQHLATPENIQALVDYELIISKQPMIEIDISSKEPQMMQLFESPVAVQPEKESVQDQSFLADQVRLLQWEQKVIEQNQILQQEKQVLAPEALSFEQIKNLMLSSLKSYCGLLGFGLMRDIQQASRMAQLRMCQMQWVTLLSESKADAMQVKNWISQMNYSYQQMNKD